MYTNSYFLSTPVSLTALCRTTTSSYVRDVILETNAWSLASFRQHPRIDTERRRVLHSRIGGSIRIIWPISEDDILSHVYVVAWSRHRVGHLGSGLILRRLALLAHHRTSSRYGLGSMEHFHESIDKIGQINHEVSQLRPPACQHAGKIDMGLVMLR